MPTPEFLIVGRIRKAHGIRGEVLVEPVTDSRREIFAPGRQLLAGDAAGELDEDGATLTIATVRDFKAGILVAFQEIPDRTVAEGWRDRYLLLAASELAPLAPGEVYVHDLVGMEAVRADGSPFGTVREVYELPQGLVLDITMPNAQSVMLPFQQDVVRSIDVAARRMVVEPMPGLID